jgi:hypothetical protein
MATVDVAMYRTWQMLTAYKIDMTVMARSKQLVNAVTRIPGFNLNNYIVIHKTKSTSRCSYVASTPMVMK